MKDSIRGLVIGLLLLGVVLAANGILAFRNVRQLDEDARWVAHTHEVIDAFGELESRLRRSFASQRSYLITTQSRFSDIFTASINDANSQLERIEQLTADSPAHQERLPELRRRVASVQSRLAETMRLRDEQGFEAVRDRVAAGEGTGDGTQEMTQVRELLEAMTRDARRFLVQREAATRRAANVAIVTAAIASISGLIGLVIFGELLRRYLKARAKSAKQLAEQKELLRATLSGIGDGVIATDVQGLVSFMNPIAQSLTGWAEANAVGRPLEEVFRIVNEETRETVENPALRALQEGQIVGLANHTVLLSAQGEERPIDDSAAPIINLSGEITGAVLVFRDVTKRRQADRALRERADISAFEVEMVSALTRHRPLEEMLARCAEVLAQRLNGALARIWTLDPAGENLILRASAGIHAQADGGHAVIPMGKYKIGHIAENRTPTLTNDLANDPRFQNPQWARDYHLTAFAGYPLVADDRVVGVMAMFADHDLSEATLQAMSLVADAVSLAVLRKWTEQDLQDASDRLELALAAANIGTYRWDLETGRQECDDNHDQLFGCTPESRPRHLDDFLARVHPDDQPTVVAHCQLAAADGAHIDIQYRVVWPDGSHHWISDCGKTFRDEHGVPLYLTGTRIDINDHKLAQEVIRESTRQFQTLADSIPQLAWMADPTGEVIWFNQRWYDYTGSTLEAMRGTGWQELVDPEALAEVAGKLRYSFQTGEPWEDTFRLRRADGVYRWHLSRMLPVRDDKYRIVRWFGTNTDITEQLEAARRKDEFLAMLGHELRNPLAGIVTGVQVLSMLPLSPEAQEMQAVIGRQASHMSHIVDDLLDVSRIARGKLSLRSERLDLVELVRTTVGDYQNANPVERHEFTVQLPDTPLWLPGDPTRLAQVVTNLIHNACKFSDRENHITVSLQAAGHGNQAVLKVTDRGIGMSAELLSSIFEPFHQADKSLDRSRGGLGLGLALVKGIIELHGGSVTATSPGEGLGTEFAVTLPLDGEAAPATSHTSGESHPARARVLLIDDRRDAILPIRKILEMAGHYVQVATTGQQGLEQAAAQTPDVILCDIGLDGSMDGYDVARALRAESASQSVYLVAVTGYGNDEDRRLAQDAGFDYHLTKPVARDELLEIIQHRPRFH